LQEPCQRLFAAPAESTKQKIRRLVGHDEPVSLSSSKAGAGMFSYPALSRGGNFLKIEEDSSAKRVFAK
jgi:hypothetical protein